MVDFRLQRSNPAIRTLNKIADSHCLHWQGSNQVSTIVKLLIAYALREFLSGNYLALFTRVGTGGKGVEPSFLVPVRQDPSSGRSVRIEARRITNTDHLNPSCGLRSGGRNRGL